jgi:hypothetical protein
MSIRVLQTVKQALSASEGAIAEAQGVLQNVVPQNNPTPTVTVKKQSNTILYIILGAFAVIFMVNYAR